MRIQAHDNALTKFGNVSVGKWRIGRKLYRYVYIDGEHTAFIPITPKQLKSFTSSKDPMQTKFAEWIEQELARFEETPLNMFLASLASLIP